MVNPMGQDWVFPSFGNHLDAQGRSLFQQHTFRSQPGFSLGDTVLIYLRDDRCSIINSNSNSNSNSNNNNNNNIIIIIIAIIISVLFQVD